MGSVGHIIGTLFRAIVRVLFVGIICGVIGAAVIVGASYFEHPGGQIGTLTYIVAGVVGLLALYAGGVTVLMIEAVKAAMEAAKDVGKEAGTALKEGGSLLQAAEKEIGKHI